MNQATGKHVRKPAYTNAQADYGMGIKGNPYVNTFSFDRWDQMISEATNMSVGLSDQKFSDMYDTWRGFKYKPLIELREQKVSSGKSPLKTGKKVRRTKVF